MKKKVLKMVGYVLGGFILLGACSALLSDEQPPQEEPQAVEQPGAVQEPEPQEEPKEEPKEEKKPEWVEVVKFSTSSPSGASSKRFELEGGDLRVTATMAKVSEFTSWNMSLKDENGVPVKLIMGEDGKKKQTFDVYNVPPGTYYVELRSANTETTIKIEELR